ncbi:MAG: DUF202 domain-containing protein [Actinomycetota bacterium]|nr:DUF202 domain-containing protein [Actinomycetota bacterium]
MTIGETVAMSQTETSPEVSQSQTSQSDTGADDVRSGLARRVFPKGSDPDPRFTLANERTFLAWIRTALAFVAAGVALEAFALGGLPPVGRKAIAIALIVTGMLAAATAGRHWWRAETAMRQGRSLPFPTIVPLIAIASAIGSAAAVVLVLTA